MCEPTTLFAASLAISAASSAATVSAQRTAGKTQAAYQQDLVAANNSNTAGALSQLRIQQDQSAEARARETEKARLATQRSKASAQVAAGQAGVSGNSVDALLQEYDAQLGQYTEATLRQKQLDDIATGDQIAATRTGANYQNLQINQPVARPAYLAEGLKLGGAALGAYRDYNPSAFTRTPKLSKT